MGKDGYIDYHEIKVAMRALGFELGKEEVLDAMAAHNVQPHDQMSRDAFVKMMTLYVANRDPEEEIERAFRLFDTSGLGKIRLEDLKRVAQDLDAHLSDA